MRRIDAPALARSAGDRLRRAAGGDARGDERARPRACCWRPSSTGATARTSPRRCLERGLVVNNVTPTALRFAPPLTVSDDEIDEAVAIVKEVLA